ncbi:MAG TPA: AAA family ATPase [Caulobacteraceae bacterium]
MSEDPPPAAIVAKAILEWAAEQPLWRQEALRRVLRRAHTDTDKVEIADAIVADIGGEPKALEPLAEQELPLLSASETLSAVLELHSVQDVNRLAPGQALKFGDSGVTVLYGHNGAGKSGYARIFKRACGARDAEIILPNIFASMVPSKASATFTVRWNGQQADVNWNDPHPDPKLAKIAIFDSKTAPFFVEKRGGLSYVPFGLDVFERLCALLDAAKENLEFRQRSLRVECETPITSTPITPAAGEFLADLANKSESELESFLEWGEADEAELNSLAQAAANPTVRLANLRALGKSLLTALETLRGAEAVVGDLAIAAAIDQTNKEAGAKSVAEAAANVDFDDEPLSGTGGAAWRLMFEAAEKFSTTVAYPGRTFPPIDEGDHCLLCQQELTPSARERLRRFHEFVGAEAAKEAARLAKVTADRLRELEVLHESISKLDVPPLLSTEHAPVAALFSQARAAIASRISLAKAHLQRAAPPEAMDWPGDQIKTVADQLPILEKSADDLESLITSGKANVLAEQAANAKCRKALHSAAEVVKKRRILMLSIAQLDRALSHCGTTKISKFGGELIKKNVTDQLEQAFETEKLHLRVQDIPVRLAASARKGAVDRTVTLEGAKTKVNPGQVLSEGEHRAVGLAAFLAELSLSDEAAPIVLDDPVSSLDHRRRDNVATRIAREGRHRQVIVLTHDLPFLLGLSEACSDAHVPLTRIFLERGHAGYGMVSSEPAPWDAQKLSERKNKLKVLVADATKYYEEVGEDEGYHQKVTTFFDRLRKTWERALEELVFADSVNRYRPSVQTLRLRKVVFDDDIFAAFEKGMTAASRITGHDQATALGGALPTPPDLQDLLDQLLSFEALVKDKTKGVAERRDQMTKPQAPQQVGG